MITLPRLNALRDVQTHRLFRAKKIDINQALETTKRLSEVGLFCLPSLLHCPYRSSKLAEYGEAVDAICNL